MYCVNCGVELADTEKKCPLCGVTAFHPDIIRDEAESFYPSDPIVVRKVSRIPALVVITTIFLIPMLITMLCDYQVNQDLTWAGYVTGGLLLGYVCIVLPHWFHHPNPVIFIPCGFAATGLYVLYINYASGGSWYLTFALPIIGFWCLVVTAVAALLRYVRRGQLYIFGGAFMASGAFMPVIELLLTITFHREKFFGWSFYPLIALCLLGGMLLFLAIWKPARESMERKFFI